MTGGLIKATGADTAGAYAVVEFRAARRRTAPAPSSSAHHRRGRTHLRRVRAVPARFLVIVSPPELLGFFEQSDR